MFELSSVFDWVGSGDPDLEFFYWPDLTLPAHSFAGLSWLLHGNWINGQIWELVFDFDFYS